MTAESDPVLQAINNARALLDTLLSSQWREVHVVSGDTEIFLARNGGGANPMRAPAPVAAPVTAIVERDVASEHIVTAPHVATLVDTIPAGTAVAPGQKIGTIRVLDTLEAIEAPVAGTIARIEAADGDLLDYGTAVLVIAKAA